MYNTFGRFSTDLISVPLYTVLWVRLMVIQMPHLAMENELLLINTSIVGRLSNWPKVHTLPTTLKVKTISEILVPENVQDYCSI